MADQKEFKRRLKKLMNKKENLSCVDCDEKQPRWASLIKPPPGSPDQIGMGAFMCLECSGSHRRLGVHISFVRSVNLDSWKEHEVRIMENGGNGKVNSAFEALLSRSGSQKPDNTANGQQRERYIRDKYERRKFYDPSALQEYESESEEEDVPQQAVRRAKKPVAALSRAPSEAAQRRAASRQARLSGTPSVPDRPGRINAKPEAPQPVPQTDLLDFASFEAAPVAPAPAVPPAAAAPASTPAASEPKNETLDLFANMSVSGLDSGASAAPAKKTNQDIMSLFNTPQQPTNMMFAPQMMGQSQQGQQQQVNPMMQQQQVNPMMQQQQMMMMQQQMMMMQQQNTANVNQPSAPNTSQQVGMMGMNQVGMQGMMQQPQQQQPHNNMTMNSMTGQQVNPMMMQQNNMQGMALQQQQPGVGGMQMMMQPTPNNGNFGNMAPTDSGPTMQQQQAPSSPQKEDPFSQFGVNAFR